MRLPEPLVHGRLLRRYQRFLADVRLDDGAEVTAHCANPGRMTGIAEAGLEVWLSRSPNGARKLPWTWELVHADATLVGANPIRANAIVAEAIGAGRVPELAGYQCLRREVRYGRRSRVDLLLEGAGRPTCYVEVKNVHLKRATGAEFPDAVTARGTRHLAELAAMAEAGHRAVAFYLVQRADCADFRIAADIDPAYDAALARALDRGVESLCYACRVSPRSIEVDRRLAVVR